MKKILLTAFAAATVFGASAATELTKVWQAPVENAWEEGSAVYNAPVALDSNGNLIATGAFSEDFTLAGTTLSAIGTSAYLAKYDATGAAKWAVALSGAVTIADITTDSDNNIYIAGRYADEVELGTTTGTATTITGQLLYGAPASKMNASFIAKYTADGELVNVREFIANDLADLASSETYFPEDGDVIFHITHLQAEGDKLYASAIYTGETTIDGVSFKGSYNDPWFGVWYTQLKSVGIFSLDNLLANCKAVATLSLSEPLATEENQYQADAAAFTVAGGSTYAAFSCNGPMSLATAEAAKTLEIEAGAYNYVLAEIKDGAIAQTATFACPDAGFDASYVPFALSLTDGNLTVLGYESFANNYGEENEYLGNEFFAYSGAANALADATKTAFEAKDGAVTYYALTQAATAADGSLIFGSLGYYNTKGDDYAKGDFAGSAKTYTFADGAFKAFETVADAIGVADNGSFAAFAQTGATGAAYSLYKDANSGVEGVIAADENAPVEYFNLQGMRVENPAAGIFIRRQGAATSKVVIK